VRELVRKLELDCQIRRMFVAVGRSWAGVRVVGSCKLVFVAEDCKLVGVDCKLVGVDCKFAGEDCKFVGEVHSLVLVAEVHSLVLAAADKLGRCSLGEVAQREFQLDKLERQRAQFSRVLDDIVVAGLEVVRTIELVNQTKHCCCPMIAIHPKNRRRAAQSHHRDCQVH